MVNFPASLDALVTLTSSTKMNDAGYEGDTLVNALNRIAEALEAKVGTGATVPAAGYSLMGTGANASTWRLIPSARAFHSAAQSIANTTSTTLAFNSERFDTDTIHDTATNNSRLTCKTAGKYLIAACVEFATGAGTRRLVDIRLNNSTVIARLDNPPQGGGVATSLGITTMYDLAVNDYVEVQVFQDSGGALNINSSTSWSPEFSMVRVGG